MKLPLFSKKKPNPARVLWVPAAETQRASGLTKQDILAKPLSSYPAKSDVSEDCCRLPHPGRLPGSCPEQPARAALSCCLHAVEKAIKLTGFFKF